MGKVDQFSGEHRRDKERFENNVSGVPDSSRAVEGGSYTSLREEDGKIKKVSDDSKKGEYDKPGECFRGKDNASGTSNRMASTEIPKNDIQRVMGRGRDSSSFRVHSEEDKGIFANEIQSGGWKPKRIRKDGNSKKHIFHLTSNIVPRYCRP